MEIYLEELKKVNGFVKVFDDDGMITIQMSVESVNKIIDAFDDFIIGRKEHKDIVEVTEFGITFKLDLSLKIDNNGFHLTGSRIDTSNFYPEFELEYCDMETWDKIKILCKS